MCLAVPMKIMEIDGIKGVVDLSGARYDADLTLIEDPKVGEYVIVHAGYAIETLDRRDAEERLALFEEMAALHRKEGQGG
jgi:hydrogenase expression/formation protein HypC